MVACGGLACTMSLLAGDWVWTSRPGDCPEIAELKSVLIVYISLCLLKVGRSEILLLVKELGPKVDFRLPVTQSESESENPSGLVVVATAPCLGFMWVLDGREALLEEVFHENLQSFSTSLSG